MKTNSMTLRYALRLVRGEWRKYILPVASLSLTALVVTCVALLTSSVEGYLAERNRAAVGGDVAVRGNFAIEEDVWGTFSSVPIARTREQTFSGTLQHGGAVASVSFRVVDESFPLVGSVVLRDGSPYTPLAEDAILLDANVAERLAVHTGSTVMLGEIPYRVAGIIEQEPDALFGGFRFLPRVLMSFSGLARSGLTPELLRADYQVSAVLSSNVPEREREEFRDEMRARGYRVELAGDGSGGALAGLSALERFLGVVVLVTALLAAVNVYVGILAIERRFQRSFAILRALGTTNGTLIAILGVTLGAVVLVAGVVGTCAGYLLADSARDYVAHRFGVFLPDVVRYGEILYMFGVVCMTTLSASLPVFRMYRTSVPRALLTNEVARVRTRDRVRYGVFALFGVGVPLVALATFALGTVATGVVALFFIALVYLSTVALYRTALLFLYRVRRRFGFLLRVVIAEKRDDGVFGAVSFGSLFVGLVAFVTLALTHASLTEFLRTDLSATLPPLYVIDVQESQRDSLALRYPDLVLFPNVGARIIAIDDLRVQDALALGESGVDRELGREFNITYRSHLLADERVVEGTWQGSEQGLFSVERDFAERAGIRLGARITLSVQGFEVAGTVSSIRDVETRNGLPFFYFVGSPADLARFPTTYFGYLYGSTEEVDALEAFVAREMPNVSVIDTAVVRTLSQQIVDTLLLLSYLVALPGLVLACLLIIALVLLSYQSRRRDGARLLAIGMRARMVEFVYVLETVSTTLLASVLAYLVALGATAWLVYRVLEIEVFEYRDAEVLVALGALVAGVAGMGVTLWRTDSVSLRHVLAYEENY